MTTSTGRYDPAKIEPKWQAFWEAQNTFGIGNPGDEGFDSSRPKYYALDMFPYPSGSGLHVGHPEGYTATDILSRYKRMNGHNVLHPIGWDAFGLPAEQYALENNVHPSDRTNETIANFKKQLKRLGFSYDWNREFSTTDERYYRWTQWIFLQMFDSWFDPHATAQTETGSSYTGKARPIAELRNELEQGTLLVAADNTVHPSAGASTDLQHWSDLDVCRQRLVIDAQRLAFQDEIDVNWCPQLGTVLANEEVTNEGRSERGDYPVFKKPLKQWMLRISTYCDRLIDDLENLDWPEAIKAMQRNWIGKSTGATVNFRLADAPDGTDPLIPIFTTRPDTLFGATYMVIAPEHPLVAQIVPDQPETRTAVNDYVSAAKQRSDLDRSIETKEKTGVFSGAYAINPVNDERVPIWIADYVLMGYGTGAIMAVPAHDTRDFEFAQTFNIPIRKVVQAPSDESQELPFTGIGKSVDSGQFSGMDSLECKQNITQFLEENRLGKSATNYKLRDWLFSRQRYWGEPFPILHGPEGEIRGVPEDQLPLTLPHMDDFQPVATTDPDAPPQPPLSRATDWNQLDIDGTTWRRELNTMPQWAGSCWYYLRFVDPINNDAAWSNEAESYWMNVDQYIGGAEHAVLHLLYARFWHKVLFDLGHVSTVEPFQKLFNQGLILSFAYKDKRGMTLPVDKVEERDDTFFHLETGEEVQQIVAKMSKTLKNVVNPDEIISEFGADTFRLYEMYMGPLDAAKPWNTRDIPGLSRFLARVWRLIVDEQSNELSATVTSDQPTADHLRLLHRTIKKVTEDIESLKFNTAIAELISFTNEMTAATNRPREVLEQFILLLSPFAPHIAEELWNRLGKTDTLAYVDWPRFDDALIEEDSIEVPVQVNGKVKAKINVPANATKEMLEQVAQQEEAIQTLIAGKTIRKVVVVPGRLVNIVAT